MLLGIPVNPAETTQPIEMPFGEQTRISPKEACTSWGCTLAPPGEYDRVNDTYAAAMRPYVKLLSPFVTQCNRLFNRLANHWIACCMV